MKLPKFLIAGNLEYPDSVYVLHTGMPRFIVDIDTREVVVLDGTGFPNEPLDELITQAFGFCANELTCFDCKEIE